jgi:hypothetical protein
VSVDSAGQFGAFVVPMEAGILIYEARVRDVERVSGVLVEAARFSDRRPLHVEGRTGVRRASRCYWILAGSRT